MADVAEHAQTRTLHEVVITPDHVERTESPEFRASKERLRADGHYKCYVCGTDQNIQIHHHACEWSLSGVADWDKVKAYCEEFDPLGYGRLLRNQPMTSADDIRNMLPLCFTHHLGIDHDDGGSGTGIHTLSYPVWIIQKLARDGANPIPQPGETEAQTEAEVKAKEETL